MAREHRFFSSLLAGVLVVLAPAARADPPSLHYCEISIDFSLNGKRVGAPSAIVEFGQEAEVTIGDPDGHAWRFRILADAPALDHRVTVIPVGIALDEIVKGDAYTKASPQLKAVPGQRADIETIFGNGDGRHAHLAVVANPRSDADIEALRANAGSGDSN
jgi:hypothetical protein